MFASMRVIVFASQKGGSGKTTLSGHIAVEAGRQGAGPVALIDTDPQGSLAKWWNVRQDPEPAFIQSVFSNLFQDLNRARDEGFRLVVIDTPPAVTRAISEVVGFADLVVAPTRPSPHDLRAVGPTVDIAESRGKPLVFVINGATPKARITSEAAIALSQHGTVSPTVLHHRVDFAAAMIDGRTVMEIDPVCKSALEVKEVWKYLHERLMRQDGGYRTTDGQYHVAPAAAPATNGAQKVFGRRFGS
jgi:chromosome partitioning protein